MSPRQYSITPHDLVATRQARGVSLEFIAGSTRIGVRYLEAIERCQFGKLPGGVYTKSYLRQYARAAGFDEAALLEYYRETAAPAADTGPEPAHPVSLVRRLIGRVARAASRSLAALAP
jgi:cytoskeletal protein RodZ